MKVTLEILQDCNTVKSIQTGNGCEITSAFRVAGLPEGRSTGILEDEGNTCNATRQRGPRHSQLDAVSAVRAPT